MNRRSFFTGLAKAAAIIALAPQIAFRAKLPEVYDLPFPDCKMMPYWLQTSRVSACYDAEYVKIMNHLMGQDAGKLYRDVDEAFNRRQFFLG